MNSRYARLVAMMVCGLILTRANSAIANNEKSQAAAETATDGKQAVGARHAFIVCGLPGDADHHKLFSETVSKLQDGLVRNAGFPSQNIAILFGAEAVDGDSEVVKRALRSSSDELKKAVEQLRQSVSADDTVWVIVLGHTHHDGRNSWLNLPGPDMNELEFANLFNGLSAREQVFFVTTPTSGFWIKPLSAKGRVIVTATEDGWETNETEFPHELARILASPSVTTEFDVDEDGANTLFDLYVTVSRNIAQSYLDRELLATEHPLLDDNGDRKGTEVQIDFLTVEQGGRLKRTKPAAVTVNAGTDGSTAKRIRLLFPVAEPTPPAADQ